MDGKTKSRRYTYVGEKLGLLFALFLESADFLTNCRTLEESERHRHKKKNSWLSFFFSAKGNFAEYVAQRMFLALQKT